jgi:hypothetical protein
MAADFGIRILQTAVVSIVGTVLLLGLMFLVRQVQLLLGVKDPRETPADPKFTGQPH